MSFIYLIVHMKIFLVHKVIMLSALPDHLSFWFQNSSASMRTVFKIVISACSCHLVYYLATKWSSVIFFFLVSPRLSLKSLYCPKLTLFFFLSNKFFCSLLITIRAWMHGYHGLFILFFSDIYLSKNENRVYYFLPSFTFCLVVHFLFIYFCWIFNFIS